MNRVFLVFLRINGLWEALRDHLAVILLVAVFVAVGGFFWQVVVSVLTSVFYSVRVHGEWDTEIMQNQQLQPHESATLYQLGSRIWGKTKSKDGRQYRVTGRLCADKLCMVYKELAVGFDTGAILLQIDPDGQTMEGYEVGCVLQTKQVIPREYHWRRR